MRALTLGVLHFYPDEKFPTHTSFKLIKGENIVGRSVLSDIILAYPDISDQHCKITLLDENEYSIEDMNSTHGVFRDSGENIRIKLKPEKEYELVPNKAFYLANKYKCVFEPYGSIEGINSQLPLERKVTTELDDQPTLILEEEDFYGLQNPEMEEEPPDKIVKATHKSQEELFEASQLEKRQRIPKKKAEKDSRISLDENTKKEEKKVKKESSSLDEKLDKENVIEVRRSPRKIKNEEKSDERNKEDGESLTKKSKSKEKNEGKQEKTKQTSSPNKNGLTHEKQKVKKDRASKNEIENEENENEKTKEKMMNKKAMKIEQSPIVESGIKSEVRRRSSRLVEKESPQKLSEEKIKTPENNKKEVSPENQFIQREKVKQPEKTLLKKRSGNKETLIKFELKATSTKKIKSGINTGKPVTPLKSILKSPEKSVYNKDFKSPEKHSIRKIKERDSLEKNRKSPRKSPKEALEEEPSPDNRLIKRNAYQIMFSGLELKNNQFEDDKRKLVNLGAKIVEEKEKNFNLLIMDKFKRTIKFLLAVSKGIDIVNYNWVRDSIEEKQLLPTEKYISVEKGVESKYKFKLSSALNKAKTRKEGLLSEYRVYLAPNLKPSNDEIKLLIESLGGTVIKTKPVSYHEDSLVILDENDIKNVDNFIDLGFQPYTTELVYSCILQQKLNLKNCKISNKK